MNTLQASLAGLPDEVIQSILFLLPPQSATAIELTARRFAGLANEPLLWRYYCNISFRYWDRSHDIVSKFAGNVSAVDWKQLFIRRHYTDRLTTEILDSILASQPGRIEKFERIVAFGYDAKETLLRHHHVGIDAEDALARRYFGDAVLGCLHRTMAVPEWNQLKNGDNIGLDRALGVYDMFILHDREGDFDDISRCLMDIVTSIRQEFPNIYEESPRYRALAIARYLRAHDLTGIAEGGEYHDIRHSFMGMALLSQHHSSLPLISVVIYCHIAQQFGLDAQPCGFPFHVHAIIHSPPHLNMDGRPRNHDVGRESMYMDPFRSAEEVPIGHLISQLDMMGTLPRAREIFLGEASTIDIVLRCGRNIAHSIQPPNPIVATTNLADYWDSQVPDSSGAYYAALWASLLLGNASGAADGPMLRRQRLAHFVEHFAAHYPTDVALIEQFILPIFQHLPEYAQLCSTMRAVRSTDAMPKQVRRRSKETEHVRHRIGQVFRHRRYGYQAVITGWDPQCGAGQEWIREMGVDRLQRGRHQSFYHVLVTDRSVRYVAEENIEIETPQIPYELIGLAGRHFKRWDEASRTFVSNIKDEYPDD